MNAYIMVQCIEGPTKYLRYACKPLPQAKPCKVLARPVISELVWHIPRNRSACSNEAYSKYR